MRPAVMDCGSPSMAVTRSTSISGSFGNRTRVGCESSLGERRAQHLADGAHRELHELVAVENDGALRGRRVGGKDRAEVVVGRIGMRERRVRIRRPRGHGRGPALRHRPDQLLLVGDLESTELLRPSRGAQVGLVRLDRGLGGL